MFCSQFDTNLAPIPSNKLHEEEKGNDVVSTNF